MNINKLNKLLEEKGAKADIIRKTGITRPTIDSILSGGDLRVSTLEKITSALNINVGYLFDEEVNMEVRTAGRDYVENGDIYHRDESSYGRTESELLERIASLQSQLNDKERIIRLYESRQSE